MFSPLFLTVFFISMVQSFRLPAFDYATLTKSGLEIVETMKQEGGIFTVRGIPHYQIARQNYLKSAYDCLQKNKDQTSSIAAPAEIMKRQMHDKGATTRYSITTSQHQTTQLRNCPQYNKDKDALTSIINDVISKFSQALDVIGAIATSQQNLTEFINHAVQLDQYHAYEKQDATDSEQSKGKMTLQMHTDVGLTLAMTAPEYYTEQEQFGSGFYIKKNQQTHQVDLQADELTMMMGEAFQTFFPQYKVPAVVHGVKMAESFVPLLTRGWFGRMILAPKNVVMKEENKYDPTLTFGAYADQTRQRMEENKLHANEDFNAIACRQGRQLFASDKTCLYQTCESQTHTKKQCETWCNNKEQDTDNMCGQHCQCENKAVESGHQCWMLCLEK